MPKVSRPLKPCNLDKCIAKLQAFVKEHKNDEPPRRPTNAKIRVFSDCSGIGTEMVALLLLGLGQHVEPVGGSELDPDKRVLLQEVHKQCGFDGCLDTFGMNAVKRDPESCPSSDLYISGFPCPSFSSLGKGQGMGDAKKRGLVIIGIIKYLAVHKPSICILENVKGLLAKKNQRVQTILQKSFKHLGYVTRVKVLNTAEHSVPHSRHRVYIVAIHERISQEHAQFRFPKKTGVNPCLQSFLHTDIVGNLQLSLEKFNAKLTFPAARLWSEYWVLDVGCSEKFTSVPSEKENGKVAPCLTKKRCNQGHYYIPKLKRYMTMDEMCSFQAWPKALCYKMLAAIESKRPRYDKKKCEGVVAGAAGDGMSVNLLMRVLGRAIKAAKLWPKKVVYQDVWLSTGASEAHNLADSLWEKFTTTRRE